MCVMIFNIITRRQAKQINIHVILWKSFNPIRTEQLILKMSSAMRQSLIKTLS